MSWGIWIGLGFVAVILVAGPFMTERARPAISDAKRRGASGQFATLTDGITHFEWHGPKDGPVIILVHGLTTPSFVWRGMTGVLGAAGFRVMSYDLYGRGLSDRPLGLQDRLFFVGQLAELLDREEVDRDITFIGYSMGGAIATCFASMYPSRTRQIVLLAPAGMQRLSSGMLKIVRDVPGLGDWLMHLVYPTVLRRGLDQEKTLESSVPGINDLQRAELELRGFLPAVLSSIRGLLSETLAADHQCIAKWEIPVLAIWGSADQLIPLRASDQLRAWNPEADQEVIEGAGHGLTYTHTDKVLRIIEGWLV